MALHIDSIRPDHGQEGKQWVSLSGDLGGATKVLWGDTELSYQDWDEEDYDAQHTDLDFEIPPGKGTVQVTAVSDEEKSNTVQFTYT